MYKLMSMRTNSAGVVVAELGRVILIPFPEGPLVPSTGSSYWSINTPVGVSNEDGVDPSMQTSVEQKCLV